MIIVKTLLGLIIIIGIIVGLLVAFTGILYLFYFINSKINKTVVLKKIYKFTGKLLNYIIWTIFWGIFAIMVIGSAYNIGCDIIK